MPSPDAPRSYTIGELAERAGVTRRTVRFYVTRGLIDPPTGAGRGARYTESHLARLRIIADAKEQNLTLDEVASRLESSGNTTVAFPPAPLPSPAPAPLAEAASEAWERVHVAPGVELHLAQGGPQAAPLTPAERAHLSRALRAAYDSLRPAGSERRRDPAAEQTERGSGKEGT